MGKVRLFNEKIHIQTGKGNERYRVFLSLYDFLVRYPMNRPSTPCTPAVLLLWPRKAKGHFRHAVLAIKGVLRDGSSGERGPDPTRDPRTPRLLICTSDRAITLPVVSEIPGTKMICCEDHKLESYPKKIKKVLIPSFQINCPPPQMAI